VIEAVAGQRLQTVLLDQLRKASEPSPHVCRERLDLSIDRSIQRGNRPCHPIKYINFEI
jgi:hypothetical protein